MDKDDTLPVLSTEEILTSSNDEILSKMKGSLSGLTATSVESRLKIYGSNEVAKKSEIPTLIEFLSHFKNPLIIILILIAILLYFVGEQFNFILIVVMIFLSVVLDFFQEHRAEKATVELTERIITFVSVIRDNIKQEIPLKNIVPGDLVVLSLGKIVPADGRVIIAKDLFIDQSSLTGESFPVGKNSMPLTKEEIKASATHANYLYMGSSVLSGSGVAVVVKTGSATEYGSIIKSAVEKKPETEFDRGVKKFGVLIMIVTIVLILLAFGLNAIYGRDLLESLLFAIALAVGLTPELLPMIISVNLSKGAVSMSKKHVIVKRLASIQNFGSMDVLCTDKTGTLTENKVTVILHINLRGEENEKVFRYSFLNSYFQTQFESPLDQAILAHQDLNLRLYSKRDEIPFDFVRRRLSIGVEHKHEVILITKGAPEDITKICSSWELNGKIHLITNEIHQQIEQKIQELSIKGFRVLAIAYKKLPVKDSFSIDDESDMIFLGFIAFLDPPKESTKESLQLLNKHGIELKILTGDNELVTRYVCESLDFQIKGIVLGHEIEKFNDKVLAEAVEKNNIFARVTPSQKVRILNALKRNRHVVGFLGDGINDTPSMKAADVSISVENAVDIAKETADIILLQKDLKVLDDGVLEGRKTFGNTMKYIQMGLSSNFGNMLSAAGGSLFLPFLPMLPIQILLNNLLYDTSQIALSTDNVDSTYVEKPKKINIQFIVRFMLFFGPFSSIYDFATFFTMLYLFHSNESLFQTAWFIESLFTQTLIIFVIRTRNTPFWKSKPSKLLALNMFLILSLALLVPFTLIGVLFHLVPLPLSFLGILAIFVITYLSIVELSKNIFYRKYGKDTSN